MNTTTKHTILLTVLVAGSAAAGKKNIWDGPWNVEPLVSGLNGGGEGPVWSRQGYLLFSNTVDKKILKYVPGQRESLFRDNSNGANGNTFDRQGRLYTCEYVARRVTRTSVDGKIETLADAWQGKRLNAPNDIVVRRDGHVYFTDPLFTPLDKRDLDIYGVYHLTPDGKMDLVASPKGRPNGIALSPNGKILYVDNSDEKLIRAYDVDKAGRTSNERVVVRDLPGGADGMKVDAKGNMYVTSRGIQIYSPSGQHLGTIAIPGSVRNCAFGDRDLKSLYVTTATNLYRVRVPVKGSIQY